VPHLIRATALDTLYVSEVHEVYQFEKLIQTSTYKIRDYACHNCNTMSLTNVSTVLFIQSGITLQWFRNLTAAAGALYAPQIPKIYMPHLCFKEI